MSRLQVAEEEKPKEKVKKPTNEIKDIRSVR